jgi:excinuclease UvrABC nuclease subunit
MFNKEEECLKLLALVNERPRINVTSNKSWAKDIPNAPGIYIFFKNDNIPVYIGEAIDIKDRMRKFTGKSGHKGGYKEVKEILDLKNKQITFLYLEIYFGKNHLTLSNSIKKKIKK